MYSGDELYGDEITSSLENEDEEIDDLLLPDDEEEEEEEEELDEDGNPIA